VENTLLVQPADPREGGQNREDVARQPVVAEHADSSHDKELVARPLAGLEIFLLVKSVEESDLDQVGRPDHGRGVDQVATEDTSHTITDHLSAQAEKKVGKEAKVLAVEDLLDDSDIDRVGRLCSAVSGESDQNMLLDVEGARVEGTTGQDSSKELASGIGQQLNNQGGEEHGGRAEPQEHVHEGKEGGEEDGENKVAEGHDRKGWVVLIGDDSSNFGDGGVFLLIQLHNG